MVTFSKKMQLGGYYCREELAPIEPLRVFSTWLGDPLRGAQLEVILEVIERDRLLESTRARPAARWSPASRTSAGATRVLSGARGIGTFAAVDFPDAARRDAALTALRSRGLEVAARATARSASGRR